MDEVWDYLTSTPGLAGWLGDVVVIRIEPEEAFETTTGTTGEIRTVSRGECLRLTWQPADRDEPTTLQVTIASPRNNETKTVVRFHHERLADAAERHAMQIHWQSVLDQLGAVITP